MNQLLATSEFSALPDFLRRQQVVVVLRGATFIGALLLAWISLRPFEDLAELDLADTSSGNDAITYAVFGGLVILTGLLTISENRRGLATLCISGISDLRCLDCRQRRAVDRSSPHRSNASR